jgi:hypothetical protein
MSLKIIQIVQNQVILIWHAIFICLATFTSFKIATNFGPKIGGFVTDKSSTTQPSVRGRRLGSV